MEEKNIITGFCRVERIYANMEGEEVLPEKAQIFGIYTGSDFFSHPYFRSKQTQPEDEYTGILAILSYPYNYEWSQQNHYFYHLAILLKKNGEWQAVHLGGAGADSCPDSPWSYSLTTASLEEMAEKIDPRAARVLRFNMTEEQIASGLAEEKELQKKLILGNEKWYNHHYEGV